jgi:membrane-bound inhibitor of C-type lysozyme
MTRTLVIVLLLLAGAGAGTARAVTHAPLWNQSWGDASVQQVFDVAVDGATGRIAITGNFTGSVDFGGGTMTSAGGNDGFIATFEPDGTFIAQRQFGDAGNQFGEALAWSSENELFVTGYFAGSVNLGGGTLTSAGANDIFLARYDFRLTHRGSVKFGDASTQLVNDLTIDDGDNVIITGYYQGTVNFGGSLLTSAGSNDMYLAKFSKSLGHVWSKSFGDATGSQVGMGVGTGDVEDVFVCGYYSGTINLGGATFTSAGSNDIFLAKFSSAGVHKWSKSFGDASNQVANKIGVSPAGDVYMTGFFTGTVNLGGLLLTSAGAEDMFLAKYNSGGSHIWSKQFGDASTQVGTAVAADNQAVYLTGQGIGNVNFGLGNQVSKGGRDAYFAKFNPDGTPVWGRLFGDASDQFGIGIDVGAGRVAMAGYFTGTMDLGLGSLVSNNNDAFLMVASTDTREPIIKSVRDVPNDQGREVRVRFSRSGNDDAASPDRILRYDAYVQDTVNPMRSLMRSPAGGGPPVFMGSIPAHAQPTYEMIVPTFGDSTIAFGDFNTFVFLYAVRANQTQVYSSAIVAGSSIDNLAPGMSALALDVHLLQWRASTAPDVNYYTVYGGSTSSFGASTLINYTTATSIDITPSPRAYYFVTATDFSGNEGAPAMLRRLTGVDGPPVAQVLSISAYPNPFNPATTLRYTVPANGHVTINIYNANGQSVARIVDEEKVSGVYTAAWNGVDRSGARVSSGIYFARIESAGFSRTYKLTLLK